MKKNQLQQDVKTYIDGWYSGVAYEILYWWEDGIDMAKTWYVVILSDDLEINFVRVWKSVFNGEMSLSIDKKYDFRNKLKGFED